MRDALIAALATTPLAWIEGLDKTKAAAVAFIAVFLMGAGAASLFGEFAGHEGRIQILEAWREEHTEDVVGPRLRQIDAIQQRQDEDQRRLGRIEVLLACIYYEIDACPDPAPNPPPSRRNP